LDKQDKNVDDGIKKVGEDVKKIEKEEEEEEIRCSTCEFLTLEDKYSLEYSCDKDSGRRINPKIVEENDERDNIPEWCTRYMEKLLDIALEKKGI